MPSGFRSHDLIAELVRIANALEGIQRILDPNHHQEKFSELTETYRRLIEIQRGCQKKLAGYQRRYAGYLKRSAKRGQEGRTRSEASSKRAQYYEGMAAQTDRKLRAFEDAHPEIVAMFPERTAVSDE